MQKNNLIINTLLAQQTDKHNICKSTQKAK